MQHIIYFHVRNLFMNKMFSTCSRKLEEELCHEASAIFKSAYKAVQPSVLLQKAIEVQKNSILIKGKSFPLPKKVHIVGFGKAVSGMAEVLVHKLKDHQISGIISIPKGSQSTLLSDSGIQVFEGAMNNIPDVNSLIAAAKIKEFVSSLTESDTLFVLISGGGSALLPSPKPPLSLEEKKKVISLLASKGATIEELNSVRKRLSLLKGGNLAQLAKPATVISLILSDIIGDPLGMIASAPTVQNTDDPTLPLSITEKYMLGNEMPTAAIQLLQNIPTELASQENNSFSHVNNFIIGNNQMALDAAAETAKLNNYVPIIITKELQGKASCIGKKLISTVAAALQQNIELFNQNCNELQLKKESKQLLIDGINEVFSQEKKLCFLFGGETTVEVCGKGVGGRNQELALAAAIELHAKKPERNIILLSAGTDGIDGPSPAAGAIATASVVDKAKNEGLDPTSFLNDNDSFTFYSQINNRKWLIETGHTGTNVMDIIIILIS